jgi:hypothetical protein
MSTRLSVCEVSRRKFVRSGSLSMATGAVTMNAGGAWNTEPCNTPLFGEGERAAGVCNSCAKGWRHPHNYPAGEAPPEREHYGPALTRPNAPADSLSASIFAAIRGNPAGLTTREVGRAVGVPCSLMLERMRKRGRIVKRFDPAKVSNVWIVR